MWQQMAKHAEGWPLFARIKETVRDNLWLSWYVNTLFTLSGLTDPESATRKGKTMLASYLLAAMLSGLIGSGVWLATGGTALGAFGVYMMTGHLVMAAMFAKSYFGSDD